MKIIIKVINSILAFVLTVLIIVNFLAILVVKTVLKEEYMLSKLDEAGFYEKVDTDLKNEFAGYQYQSGFPEEIFSDLYSYSLLKSDISSIVSHIYNGSEITISEEAIYNKLGSNIEGYLAKNNITINDEQEQAIEEFKNIIVELYKSKVDSVSKYVSNSSDILVKINKADEFIVSALLIGLIFLMIFDLLLNITNFSEFVNTVGISLLSSGILLILAKFVIDQNIAIKELLIFNQSLSDFIKYVFFDILNQFNVFGIIFAALGLGSVIFASYRKAIKKAEENS